ncbi:hypothetical protein TH66_05970 [Carbonactinospora thermoautotrophica]|uniref:Sirohydrochlorin ferrochelatase n=2 Tax=Carbonactinospora thermoautotrophica TaxID=1469144 RepID=A0A132N3M2_9ACTN|nr:hypothetical protein [Carbonactinospora thermoautotrophica]KWX01078.1 Uncharacterized protein LI90_2106 [Carbonactinospora thermoautotrophica]KWX04741.1 hypothetical protein TH66_05970 [Carbonactinospora thermoautotrophica]
MPGNAPPLVLAVPGASSPAATAVAKEIATLARASLSGVDIRIGFLGGDEPSLPTVLSSDDRGSPAIVVPLVPDPDPRVEGALRRAIADAGVSARLAPPLGPHPLLAEALHIRLSEAGLARADRMRLLALITAADGIVVATSGGEEAAKSAAVTGVLLAARLAVPVAAVALEGKRTIAEAAEQLRSVGARRLALAPSLIMPNPEAEKQLVEAAEEAGCEHAEPLRAHPCVAQLVAVRYTETLEEGDTPAG